MINIKNLTQSKVDDDSVKNVLVKAAEVMGVKSKEVAVVLVGENRIRNLNKKYRGKNRVTDVLSFGADGGKEELGDIVICVPRVKKQAKQKGHSFKKELTILLVHGLLHLMGYDHEKDKDVEEMEGLEKKIFRALSKKPSPKDEG